MNTHVKALLTLGVLAVLVVGGLTWGWAAFTQPFPKTEAQPDCVNTKYHKGDRVSAPKVLVNVYNASDRVGLAERTMSGFEDQGFAPGKVGNAPKGTVVPFAQVWTRHPDNPAVQLVLSRLGSDAHVIERKPLRSTGIVVVVGNTFGELVSGRSSVKVTAKATVCTPPTE